MFYTDLGSYISLNINLKRLFFRYNFSYIWLNHPWTHHHPRQIQLMSWVIPVCYLYHRFCLQIWLRILNPVSAGHRSAGFHRRILLRFHWTCRRCPVWEQILSYCRVGRCPVLRWLFNQPADFADAVFHFTPAYYSVSFHFFQWNFLKWDCRCIVFSVNIN